MIFRVALTPGIMHASEHADAHRPSGMPKPTGKANTDCTGWATVAESVAVRASPPSPAAALAAATATPTATESTHPVRTDQWQPRRRHRRRGLGVSGVTIEFGRRQYRDGASATVKNSRRWRQHPKQRQCSDDGNGSGRKSRRRHHRTDGRRSRGPRILLTVSAAVSKERTDAVPGLEAPVNAEEVQLAVGGLASQPPLRTTQAPPRRRCGYWPHGERSAMQLATVHTLRIDHLEPEH